MKKQLLSVMGVACTLFVAICAHAADAPSPAANATGAHHEWTLGEARQHAHDYADKLDKMTETEWTEKQKKRQEWKEKYSKMTPEEKAALKKKWQEKRAQKASETTAKQ